MSQTEAALFKAGTVQAADLASTLDLSGKTVTLPSGTGGKVLQVQYNSTSSVGSLAHSADTDTPHSYLTVDITPQSETSIIYVSYQLVWGMEHFFGIMMEVALVEQKGWRYAQLS